MRLVCGAFAAVGVLVVHGWAGRDAARLMAVPQTAVAATAPPAALVGAWTLVDHQARDRSGQVVTSASAGVLRGYLVYDPGGFVSMWAQSRPAPPGVGQAAVAEARASLDAYSAHFGTFVVNEATHMVTHQTFGALHTASSGLDLRYRFTVQDTRLVLDEEPGTDGAAGGLAVRRVWQRVSPVADASPTARQLVGIWTLVSSETQTLDGDLVSRSNGMTGFLVYTATGHMMVHMMYPYRRRVVGPSPTPDETLAEYRGYTGYFGDLTVNDADHFVVHHLRGSVNSGGVGTDYQRFVTFSGRRLVLRTPLTRGASGDVRTTLTWERAGG